MTTTNDEQRPDFDAIERIAWAYFGLHFQKFMALPRGELRRLMDVAGVDGETAVGILDTIKRLSYAYFGDRFDRVLSLPVEDFGRLMDHAGIDRTRIVGVMKALRSLDRDEEMRKRFLQ
ncbi:hypothetical protein ACG33_08805 [Steroidobacter denitrificans]|uniref:Uncharacterized protein n=1 Tax=Steroidobacter denitrificans TaxID=465721 RepID=A0A127FC39_STEDE|nr:hypothetical protein [Steroidobacter denitrificans]AMN47191.1 hypothetical protein ACG33_08805 [Steroidobacter denitrificans]